MVCENINSSHKLKIDYPSKNLNKSRNLILKLLFLEIICIGLLRLATLRQLEVSRALSIIKKSPKSTLNLTHVGIYSFPQNILCIL